MLSRRKFIKNTLKFSLYSGLMGYQWLHAEHISNNYQKLVILHTNDTHSRLDPFETGDFKGLGGVAARKTIIDQIRKEEQHVILLDAGDYFQGTPYFNMYQGELEIKAMSMLGYDCVTMGNHDFDAGIDTFGKQLKHATFPVVVSNYNFDDTPLANQISKYHIIHKGPFKIGIVGMGIELEGLVHRDLYGHTQYLNPIIEANKWAKHLKYEQNCQIIIALSHLGYNYPNRYKLSDLNAAQMLDNVDVIIGGHTHTFLKSPQEVANNFGQFVIVNQVGWGGINLGRIDVLLSKNELKTEKSKSMLIKCQN